MNKESCVDPSIPVVQRKSVVKGKIHPFLLSMFSEPAESICYSLSFCARVEG